MEGNTTPPMYGSTWGLSPKKKKCDETPANFRSFFQWTSPCLWSTWNPSMRYYGLRTWRCSRCLPCPLSTSCWKEIVSINNTSLFRWKSISSSRLKQKEGSSTHPGLHKSKFPFFVFLIGQVRLFLSGSHIVSGGTRTCQIPPAGWYHVARDPGSVCKGW